jgi:hypothetical protein
MNIMHSLNCICKFYACKFNSFDRFCGLVVRVPGYRSRGHRFDSWHYQILLRSNGSGTGSTSIVGTIEELLERKRSGSSLESREYGRGDRYDGHATPYTCKSWH